MDGRKITFDCNQNVLQKKNTLSYNFTGRKRSPSSSPSPVRPHLAPYSFGDLASRIRDNITINVFSFSSTEWRLGLVICKLVPYFQGVSVNASINTLMAISVERCLSICYPMNPVGKGVCKRVVVIIWIVSLTITMPWAIYFDLQPMEEGSDNQVNNDI